MNKVLVAGGCGYIGSHTVVELIQSGYEVVILDNLSNSHVEALSGIERITGVKPNFYQLDLLDYNGVKSFFEKNEDINAVIHFAAFKAVGESIQKPMKYYMNNVNSTVNLMNIISELDREINLVFSSSCAVYGNPDVLPVSEKEEFKKAESPYGYTKQISENVIQDAIRVTKKIQAVALRYFNPVGAHSSGFIGESPLITYNLLPILVETAIGKRDHIKVFGNDYDTPDGSAVRDYIHVTDLAKAHVMVLNRLFEKQNAKKYEYFNLGLGKGISVLEIIETFEKVTGKKINYQIAPRRQGDIASVFADVKLAEEVLGWKTKLGLEEMLSSAWKWEQNKLY